MFTLTLQNSDKVIKNFSRIADPSSRRDLMDEIGAYGLSSTQERFIDQKGPDGIGWLQSERAKQQGGQTLQDTNRLFQSLTYESTETEASWGTNVIYAGIHQFGGEIKPKTAKKLAFRAASGAFVMLDSVTIPARPFAGINSQDEKEIEQITEDWLQESFQ